MQKQPHRAVEKTADNRYWQNQTRTDDAELDPPAEFDAYEPPTLHPRAATANAPASGGHAPRVADGAPLRTPRGGDTG